MKNLIMKIGNAVAVLALVAASVNVNSTCCHYIYQGPVPKDANRLRKVR